MTELTRIVEHDNLLHNDPGKIQFAAGGNPINHVIYVIKENRTYDQILGDLKVGDGDPSLTMYGADITPNEHKLALQFGVLDNFTTAGKFRVMDICGRPRRLPAIQRKDVADCLSREGADLRFSGHGRRMSFRWITSKPDIDDPSTGFSGTIVARRHASVIATTASM